MISILEPNIDDEMNEIIILPINRKTKISSNRR